MTSERNDYEVIVIGGGPAGSTAAALIAEQKHSVVLFEREKFPRFKIGESLMPGTHRTLTRLGVLDKMKNSMFPKKYSVQFYGKSGKAGAPFYFFENEEGQGAQTWQVLRSEFDHLMIENARTKGAEVFQGASVIDVLFEGERARGVRVKMPDKQIKEFKSDVVVDASGQSALLSRKLRISREEPALKNAAIYTHFKGAHRDQGVDEGATIVFHTRNGDSWFWYIPLPEDVVSVGVVGSIDYLLKNRKEDAQDVFSQELENCPALRPRLKQATQLFPVKVTKEFSYKADEMAGEGWVLIGDAFGFLDPIYSSGIFLALKSGEFAADAVNEAFEKKDFSASQLGKFGPEFGAGMNSIRKLVYAFYTPNFSFAKFLKDYPHCREDVINILVGNVFEKPTNSLFEHLGEYCTLPD